MPDERVSLTKEEIRMIVHETLVSIGVDINDPMEFQADARFVRKLRQTHERIGVKAIVTLVGVLVTGSISLIILGAVALIKQKTGG